MSNIVLPALSVLYEDNHLLVVNKPAGMLTQSDRSGAVSLLDLCREYIRVTRKKTGNVFIGMVHRLDRPVCGVIVFALTSKAASRLSARFRNGEADKRYLAVVEGHLEGAGALIHSLVRRGSVTLTLDAPEPGELATQRVRSSPREPRQDAALQYRSLSAEERASLLEITLLTGRKHQIRAQLSAIGHPVLGDRKYGSLFSLGPDRIALMCSSLSIAHPTRGEVMTFTAPQPDWWPLPPS